MAKIGFCDAKPLLDLHKKAEETRPPLRRWASACGQKDRRHPPEGAEPRGGLQVEPAFRRVKTCCRPFCGLLRECSDSTVLLYHRGFKGLPSLHSLVPSLLRHEVEKAMEKLDVIWDRTYAWDMFLDMMELLHFQDETLYLAINLMNRGLRQIKVSMANLQLLGVVCLFLAAKKEECLFPEVSELCYLMDNGYTKRQLLRMERKVLCGLQFDLSHCPPLHFLLLTATIARCSAKVVWMARYLLELSLLEGQCVVYLPMQLAGAALCLARRVLQEPPTPDGDTAWCIASSIHIGSETALLRIMHILAGAAAKAHCRENRATFVKYSSAETMHVSSHPVLQNAPCLLALPPALHT
ncbi:hypothetical protein CRUP_029879 [Coryphaenoides rupestris]|nr:hypothetical protein CRUP_029879 [Coryphaenoides rupestris]